jgi:hypothetical protein
MLTDSKDLTEPAVGEKPWLTCEMCDNAFQPTREHQRPFCSATCEANWMAELIKQQRRQPRFGRGGY